jgi:hypothetical protein
MIMRGMERGTLKHVLRRRVVFVLFQVEQRSLRVDRIGHVVKVPRVVEDMLNYI